MAQKTTNQIRILLNSQQLNFEEIQNKALNDYLPKLFQMCPFTEDLCKANQCVECEVFKNQRK
jgi:hypothetical protein